MLTWEMLRLTMFNRVHLYGVYRCERCVQENTDLYIVMTSEMFARNRGFRIRNPILGGKSLGFTLFKVKHFYKLPKNDLYPSRYLVPNRSIIPGKIILAGNLATILQSVQKPNKNPLNVRW